jgi:hypothetical protein
MKTNTDSLLNSSRPITRLRSSTSPILFWSLVSVIFFAIILLARVNALTFPLPNEDDARFFFPAWSVALHGTLSASVLNAPEGVFWMPHGFYVWLALFLHIFGPTIDVARTVCQLTMATAAVLLVIAYAHLSGSRGFALLCGALLVSPGVIFAANIIRMESLVLLLFATGLLLHSYRYYVAASAIFLLSVVVHPALLLGAALYTIGVFWEYVTVRRSNTASLNLEREARGGRMLTLAIVVMAVIAIALESIYVLQHLATFHQHMSYQIARKAGRGPIQVLLTKRGFFLVVEAVFTSVVVGVFYRHIQVWPVFIRELVPIILLTLGLSAYATFGREIPYNVYSYAVVPATFCCLTYRMLVLLTEDARTESGRRVGYVL